MTTLPVWFYNLRVGRSVVQVRQELNAILDTKPAFLGMCEAVGYSLPRIDGYRLIRDRSTPSRANIAAYVKRGGLSHVHWYDMDEKWPRTEHPGMHEPRSWLEFRYHGIQVLVGHQPPKFTKNTIPAQKEGIDFLTDRMAPWTHKEWKRRTEASKARSKARPRVVIMDANRGPREEGPGPKKLAQNIDGKIVGTRIDLGVYREARVANVGYPTHAGREPLLTDHKHGFSFDLIVPDRWV